MTTRLLILATLSTLLVACTQSSADGNVDGAALLAPFKQNLKMALIKGMESGPVEAITACRSEAPMISGELSVDGVVMGRSSHRLRNPGNAAPDWVAPVIDSYAFGDNGYAPVGMELAGNRWGYVEPILLQPMCLNCHGSELHPDVAARLNELYPNDQATGFSAGDFRGVFWVEFPLN